MMMMDCYLSGDLPRVKQHVRSWARAQCQVQLKVLRFSTVRQKHRIKGKRWETIWNPKSWDFCEGTKDLSNFEETAEVWAGRANAFLLARTGCLRLWSEMLRTMLRCRTCMTSLVCAQAIGHGPELQTCCVWVRSSAPIWEQDLCHGPRETILLYYSSFYSYGCCFLGKYLGVF